MVLNLRSSGPRSLAVALLVYGWIPASAVADPRRGPSAPDHVELYVHADLKDASFVEPLRCALERVLAAPVSVKASSVAIDRDLLLNERQHDVEKIAERFRSETHGTGDARTFKHLFVAGDIGAQRHNYVFASRFGQGTPNPIQVISTARLLTASGAKGSPDLLVERLYKIVLRGVVHQSGWRGQGCVLAFPNSLEGHDRKTCAVCEADRPALVAAGILRETERDTCAPDEAVVSQRTPAVVDAPA